MTRRTRRTRMCRLPLLLVVVLCCCTFLQISSSSSVSIRRGSADHLSPSEGIDERETAIRILRGYLTSSSSTSNNNGDDESIINTGDGTRTTTTAESFREDARLLLGDAFTDDAQLDEIIQQALTSSRTTNSPKKEEEQEEEECIITKGGSNGILQTRRPRYGDKHIREMQSVINDPDCMIREFNTHDPDYNPTELIRVYNKCKMVVLKNAYNIDTMTQLKSNFTQYFYSIHTGRTDIKGRTTNGEPHYIQEVADQRFEVMMPHEFAHPDIIANRHINELLRDEQVLGKDAVLHSMGSINAEAQLRSGGQDWHIDDAFLFDYSDFFDEYGMGGHDLPSNAVQIMTPLLNLTFDHGATHYCLGPSNLLGIDDPPVKDPTLMEKGSIYWDLKAYDDGDGCPPGNWRSPILNFGDAVIFDYVNKHRGGQNNSPDFRPVLYTIYSRPWYKDTNFQDNKDAEYDAGKLVDELYKPTEVYNDRERMNQLLGRTRFSLMQKKGDDNKGGHEAAIAASASSSSGTITDLESIQKFHSLAPADEKKKEDVITSSSGRKEEDEDDEDDDDPTSSDAAIVRMIQGYLSSFPNNNMVGNNDRRRQERIMDDLMLLLGEGGGEEDNNDTKDLFTKAQIEELLLLSTKKKKKKKDATTTTKSSTLTDDEKKDTTTTTKNICNAGRTPYRPKQYADKYIERMIELTEDDDCMSREFDVTDSNFNPDEATEVYNKCKMIILRNAYKPQDIHEVKDDISNYFFGLHTGRIGTKSRTTNYEPHFMQDVSDQRYEVLMPREMAAQNGGPGIVANEHVLRILRDDRVLGNDVVLHSMGSISAEAHLREGGQNWHIDDGHLFDSSSALNQVGYAGHDLPSHAVQIMSPLLNVTYDHGATNFCVGISSLLGIDREEAIVADETLVKKNSPFWNVRTFDEIDGCPPQHWRTALLNVGDLVMFDYIARHRGGQNNSPDFRAVLYTIYSRPLYKDRQFFTVDEDWDVPDHATDMDEIIGDGTFVDESMMHQLIGRTRFSLEKEGTAGKVGDGRRSAGGTTAGGSLPLGDIHHFDVGRKQHEMTNPSASSSGIDENDQHPVEFLMTNMDVELHDHLYVDGKSYGRLQPQTSVLVTARPGSQVELRSSDDGSVYEEWTVMPTQGQVFVTHHEQEQHRLQQKQNASSSSSSSSR